MSRAGVIPEDAYASRALALPHLGVLFAGILLTLAPHAGRLPIWISGITAALIGWRAWASWRGESLPRKWLIFLLVAAGLFAVYTSNRTLVGRDAGVTMLVLFLGLKLLETRQERDVIVVTFLCYFLSLTSFFYSQSIASAVHTLATVTVLTAALVGFNALRQPWHRNLRTAAILLGQAAPIMVVLFVLFPRFNGPLWGLPGSVTSGMTGISDSMTPGAISQLTQSDAVAFRVLFDGPAPARHLLYWRGPVLERFDGATWRRAGVPGPARSIDLSWRGPALSYEVTQEPNNQRWVFALDLPSGIPGDTVLSQDFEVLARQPLQQRTRFRLQSHVDYAADPAAPPRVLERDLQLPEGANPRTVALGQSLRREARSAEAVLERAIGFLRTQDLRYTMAPPLLGIHTADEFLFDTRAGFCEHFASAFVILMRAAGVPARVVTGYQGGETNPVDGYMVIRQSDAHAWAEVWLGERGWIRVDPTAIANPIRIEQGLARAVPAGDPVPFMIRNEYSWLNRLRHNWEAMANSWNQWVLGYNMDRQRDFLSRLGMKSPDLERLVNTMLWAVAAALGVVVYFMLRGARPRDPVARLWQRFCRRAAAHGFARSPYEGPSDFATRIARRFPDRGDGAMAVADAYIALRYGTDPRDAGLLAELRRRVREFRI